MRFTILAAFNAAFISSLSQLALSSEGKLVTCFIHVLVLTAFWLVCSLCDTTNTLSVLPSNVSQQFSLGECCPLRQEDGSTCVIDPVSPFRYVGISEPITPEGDTCRVGEKLIMSRFDITKEVDTSCCVSCSCHGDPECISFDGFQDKWVICDARQDNNNGLVGNCPIKRKVCEKQLDPAGNQCKWLSGDARPDGQSRCQPWDTENNRMALFPLLMYQADEYSITVYQGERGSIFDVEIKSGTDVYELNSEECLESESPWNVPADPRYFTRREEQYESDPYNDIIWTVIDETTQISATIRCVTVLNETGAPVGSRLNVESVVEPNLAYKSGRSNLDGFCYTNNLGKTGTTDHTDTLDNCTNGIASQDALIARVMCENPSITSSGVQSCREAFCSKHKHPYFAEEPDPREACITLLNTDVRQGFCEAVAHPSSGQTKTMANAECVNFIEDYGWAQAGRRYLEIVDLEDSCVSDQVDLPEYLEECEEGVELQLLQNGEWSSYLAFPAKKPVCEGVVFEFECDDYPELFTNQWRFYQRSPDKQACHTNVCETVLGFDAEVKFIPLPTAAPTPEPTTSPSVSPTGHPTASPSATPTESPTKKPTAVPTSSPTDSPTRNPTTDTPSFFPTEAPTRNPTTDTPSLFPTSSPTFIQSFTPEPTPFECIDTFCNVVYDSFECTPIQEFTGSSSTTITETLRRMPECCAEKDTQICPDSDGTELLSRWSEACNPICDRDIPEHCCNDLTNADTLSLKIAFTGTERDGVCCKSCTCYGDPRCISFDGTRQSWIPCDARDINQRWGNGICRLSRDVCLEQKDPSGTPCVWDYSKGLADSTWDVSEQGSPCLVSKLTLVVIRLSLETCLAYIIMLQSTVESWLQMYNTVTNKGVTFELNLLQGAGGERGNIREARLIVNNQGYSIRADACLSSDMPFSPMPPFQYERIKLKDDVLLQFTEPQTNISIRVRCTATFTSSGVFMERLNIEQLLEPDYDERSEVGGFCVDNDMSRTGSTENTDMIESGELCKSDSALDNTQITKIICEPYLLAGDGVDNCITSLCNTYSWPHFAGDPQLCKQQFKKFESQLEKAFCRLWFPAGSVDYIECIETIREGQGNQDSYTGWKDAAEKYIPVWSETDCETDPDKFATSLGKCEAGATLQYLNDAGDWVDYRSFPVYGNLYPCPSGVIFKATKHREVFVNRVRVSQKDIPGEECFSVPACALTESVSTELTYQRTSSC